MFTKFTEADKVFLDDNYSDEFWVFHTFQKNDVHFAIIYRDYNEFMVVKMNRLTAYSKPLHTMAQKMNSFMQEVRQANKDFKGGIKNR